MHSRASSRLRSLEGAKADCCPRGPIPVLTAIALVGSQRLVSTDELSEIAEVESKQVVSMLLASGWIGRSQITRGQQGGSRYWIDYSAIGTGQVAAAQDKPEQLQDTHWRSEAHELTDEQIRQVLRRIDEDPKINISGIALILGSSSRGC